MSYWQRLNYRDTFVHYSLESKSIITTAESTCCLFILLRGLAATCHGFSVVLEASLCWVSSRKHLTKTSCTWACLYISSGNLVSNYCWCWISSHWCLGEITEILQRSALSFISGVGLAQTSIVFFMSRCVGVLQTSCAGMDYSSALSRCSRSHCFWIAVSL